MYVSTLLYVCVNTTVCMCQHYCVYVSTLLYVCVNTTVCMCQHYCMYVSTLHTVIFALRLLQVAYVHKGSHDNPHYVQTDSPILQKAYLQFESSPEVSVPIIYLSHQDSLH